MFEFREDTAVTVMANHLSMRRHVSSLLYTMTDCYTIYSL